jgi:hypothetical protein
VVTTPVAILCDAANDATLLKTCGKWDELMICDYTFGCHRCFRVVGNVFRAQLLAFSQVSIPSIGRARPPIQCNA